MSGELAVNTICLCIFEWYLELCSRKDCRLNGLSQESSTHALVGMKSMVNIDNATTYTSVAARNTTYAVSKFAGILKPTVSVYISSVTNTSMDTTSNSILMSNRDIVVRRLYVTIACMILLTIILLCVDWLLKGKRKILKLRGRLKCLSQDPQHILPSYKTPRRSSEAPNRFNGLFVFNMSNTNN